MLYGRKHEVIPMARAMGSGVISYGCWATHDNGGVVGDDEGEDVNESPQRIHKGMRLYGRDIDDMAALSAAVEESVCAAEVLAIDSLRTTQRRVVEQYAGMISERRSRKNNSAKVLCRSVFRFWRHAVAIPDSSLRMITVYIRLRARLWEDGSHD